MKLSICVMDGFQREKGWFSKREKTERLSEKCWSAISFSCISFPRSCLISLSIYAHYTLSLYTLHNIDDPVYYPGKQTFRQYITQWANVLIKSNMTHLLFCLKKKVTKLLILLKNFPLRIIQKTFCCAVTYHWKRDGLISSSKWELN